MPPLSLNDLVTCHRSRWLAVVLRMLPSSDVSLPQDALVCGILAEHIPNPSSRSSVDLDAEEFWQRFTAHNP